MKPTFFKTLGGLEIPLPVFFPDATRAVLKTLDTTDIESTNTPGILVNTFHLHHQPGPEIIEQFKGVRPFMGWNGGVISDSGGFQVMSLAKKFGGKHPVNDEGVKFKSPDGQRIFFTPKTSIDFQFALKTDMVVVLDDFTDLQATPRQARETVERTIMWAKLCKQIFIKNCENQKIPEENRPYLLGVVQGGHNLELRRECTQRLVEIGFDGLGYGGWPMKDEGGFNFEIPQIISQNTPDNYFLYGLGVGMPDDIVGCVKLGWNIFDCVIPTRDARHRRLYIYNSNTIDNIDVNQSHFYSHFVPDRDANLNLNEPVSTACDCLLCTKYTKGYLSHLYKIGDQTAGRLATIHNLRFYSILMDKLKPIYEKIS